MLRSLVRTAIVSTLLASLAGAAATAAGNADRSAGASGVLDRVRARGVVRCAGIVRPGIAVPSPDGSRWYGIAPDVCRAIAAAVLGDASRIAFRPYTAVDAASAAPDADDVVFASGAELLGGAASAGAALRLGPAVVHDAIALLVPASGPATVAGLAGKSICVLPGTAADRALVAYFAARSLALQEHPYQEPDEMRQAYGDGKCAALAGPLTTLASVRGDPQEGHATDRILPAVLADDPIFAATTGDAAWSRIVWWTFGALVAAERDGLTGAAAAARDSLPGIPPAAGQQLGLRPAWLHDVLTAEGSYAEIFERDLGARSPYRLARGVNALVGDGGAIFGLAVE